MITNENNVRFLGLASDRLIMATLFALLTGGAYLVFEIGYFNSDEVVFFSLGVYSIALMLAFDESLPISYVLQHSLIFLIMGSCFLVAGYFCSRNLGFGTITLFLITFLCGVTDKNNALLELSGLLSVWLYLIGNSLSLQLPLLSVMVAFVLGALVLLFCFMLRNMFCEQPRANIYSARITMPLWIFNVQQVKFASLFAIVVCITYLFTKLFFVSPHMYWSATVVLFVLKKEHKLSISRLIHRMTGTVFGVIMAMFMVQCISNKASLIILLFFSAFMTLMTYLRYYGIYVFFLTILTVISFDIVYSVNGVIGERVIDTFIGGAAIVCLLIIVLLIGFLYDIFKSNTRRSLW